MQALGAVAGTKSRKRRHRLLAKLDKASDRAVLDSDGQRWGARLRVFLLLFRPSAKHGDEMLWATLQTWVNEELTLAKKEKNVATAQLDELKRLLDSQFCRFMSQAMFWMFGDVAPLTKSAVFMLIFIYFFFYF
jgi:hypothetical protein